MNRFCLILIGIQVVACASWTMAAAPWRAHGPLRVTADGHALEHTDGARFFWLGDTVWALHQNLSREDVRFYLDDAKARGFNVIHLMAANAWGLRDGKNFFGDTPYLEGDPTRPNPPYWDHLGWVIDEAAARGQYVLLVYGGPGRDREGLPFVRTPKQAYEYGRAIGAHLGGKPNLIWAGGCDANPDDPERVGPMGMAAWAPMAEGVADGVNGVNDFDGQADHSTTLMTFHPAGFATSGKWFHQAPWLDFNGAQVGLGKAADGLIPHIRSDYKRTPAKPVINIEPWYEQCRWKDPPVNDWDMRIQAYQSVFVGSHGFTYGHWSLWPLSSRRRGDKWKGVLDAPGRDDMRHLRKLMDQPAVGRWRPCEDLIVGSPDDKHSADSVGHRIGAVRTDGGALVYSPRGERFTLDFSRLAASGAAATAPATATAPDKFSARWFDPRTGQSSSIGVVEIAGRRDFTPPGEPAEGNDWILMLTVPRVAPHQEMEKPQ